MNKVKKQTVRLVHLPDSPRAELFTKTLKDLENYEISSGTLSDESNFNVFFNFSGFENDKSLLLNLLLGLRSTDTYSIFDLSDEDFLKTPDADFYILFAAASNFVTCSSEAIQEALYEQTGRLAYLVADPIEDSSFSEPEFRTTVPEVLWYGETKDIMSIRPYITKNDHNIRIATTGYASFTKDRAETTFIASDKSKDKEIQNTDVVYLPPTHNREGELRRFKKVEEATRHGKFVIAPNLDYDWEEISLQTSLEDGLGMFKDGYYELNDYVVEKQQIIKDKYSRETIKESIHTALVLAPEEPAFADVDDYISETFFLG